MKVQVALLSPAVTIAAARLIFAGFLLLVQVYVNRALRRVIRLQTFDPARERFAINAAEVLFALMNIPMALFIAESVVSPRSLLLYNPPAAYEWLATPLAYIFFIWNLGSILFALVAPLSMAAFALLQRFRRKRAVELEEESEGSGLSRRRFLRLALMAAAAMPFAVSLYGAVAARSKRVLEFVTIPIRDLPDQLDGLTIVQMSDIHAGVFMTEAQMSEYVEMANSLRPDLVALTGDFVSSTSQQVDPFMRAMSKLTARIGVFGCLGNHDMYTRAEPVLTQQFNQAGFKLLRNENQYVDVRGAKLNIIGLDFFLDGIGNGRVDDALRRIPRDGTTLLLLHAPQGFPDAAKMGIDLTLSGHTHGGQIALKLGELLITPARLATMYLAGLYKLGDSHLYVNRGLGTTGPPIRINAPPEITHITLKKF